MSAHSWADTSWILFMPWLPAALHPLQTCRVCRASLDPMDQTQVQLGQVQSKGRVDMNSSDGAISSRGIIVPASFLHTIYKIHGKAFSSSWPQRAIRFAVKLEWQAMLPGAVIYLAAAGTGHVTQTGMCASLHGEVGSTKVWNRPYSASVFFKSHYWWSGGQILPFLCKQSFSPFLLYLFLVHMNLWGVIQWFV